MTDCLRDLPLLTYTYWEQDNHGESVLRLTQGTAEFNRDPLYPNYQYVAETVALNPWNLSNRIPPHKVVEERSFASDTRGTRTRKGFRIGSLERIAISLKNRAGNSNYL